MQLRNRDDGLSFGLVTTAVHVIKFISQGARGERVFVSAVTSRLSAEFCGACRHKHANLISKFISG